MHAERFTGIDTVDAAVWERLTADHPFAGHEWCHYAETYQRRPSHYAIVYDGETPIAGAIFMVMSNEDIPITNRFVRTLVRRYLMWRPIITCRTAPTTGHKALFLPADPALRARALAELRRVACKLLTEHHGSFLLFDYLDEPTLDNEWGDFYPLSDFANVGTRLDIQWETWDEFMYDLRQRSKKQHKNVRNNTRYAQQQGITIKFSAAAPPTADVCRLVKNNARHYGHTLSDHNIQKLMQTIARLPKQNYTWVTAHQDGQIVGCEVLLYDPATGVCVTQLYGRDYAVKYVYLYMAYRDIQYMIEELKATSIIYDTEAYEFKQRLGFVEDSRNHLAFYPNSRLERGLTAVLMRFIDD